jgi:DNA-binding NarL/FixJ family response regulator
LLADQLGCCWIPTQRIRIVSEPSTFLETIKSAIDLEPQFVVMDLHMPDDCSVKPQEIKSLLGTLGSRLIAISFWNDVDTQALAESFGAVALLDKMRLVSELIPAVKDSMVTQPSKSVRSPRVGVTIEAEEHATEAKNSSNSGEPTASVPKK